MTKLVLIAIDGSDQALEAFKFYMGSLHNKDNQLLLIHSAEPPTVPSQHAMYMSAELWAEMLEAEKTKVKKLEDKYAELMRENHVSGKIKAIFGNRPGETIIQEAAENKANMIVMGTRGLGGVRRTILGSVSDYVLHHAHCPVIICRH